MTTYCGTHPDACPEEIYLTDAAVEFDKTAIHVLTWTSLGQVLLTTFAYTLLDNKAYRTFHGDSKTRERLWSDPFNFFDTDHMTYETERWRNVALTTTATWLPMLFFGMVGLSDILGGFVSFWIFHVLANLTIPVLLYNIYEILGIAVDTGSLESWGLTIIFGGLSIAVFVVQTAFGFMAMDTLKESEWDDDILLPSLFYILNWWDHIPKDTA